MKLSLTTHIVLALFAKILLTIPIALALFFALALAPVKAQGKVIPVSLTSVEGNAGSVYHFGYKYPKSQQIWRNSAITNSSVAVIKGLQYRRDTDQIKAYAAFVYTKATFSIGSSTKSPGSMSTTFATNVTSPLTVVLNAGTFNLPAQPVPTSKPAVFNVGINWTTPYMYDTTKGNLILQIELPGPDAKLGYFCDAESTVGGNGIVTPFGTGGAFANPELYKLSAAAGELAPGGSLDISCGTFKKAYTGALILGLSNTRWSGVALPWDLAVIGAPKNNLYVSLDMQFPFSATGSGSSFNSSFKAPIPGGATYGGVTFHAQAWYADSGANAAGLVATNALTLSTSKTPAAATQTVGHFNNSTPAGRYMFGSRFGGPVIKFLGVIP